MIQSTSGGPGPRGSGRSPGRVVALCLQLFGAVLVIASVIVGLTASHAGASALSNATVKLEGSGGSVATNPLVNHQLVTVTLAPNSTFSRSSLEAAGFPSGAVVIKILECADPGGLEANLPTRPTECEPATVNAGGSTLEDGSMVLSGYTIYALPDPLELGVSNGTLCDMQHLCVLGIFTDQNDYSKPHLFSAPFQIESTGTSGGATSTNSPKTSDGGSASTASTGASAAVSVPPATLADTGGPTLWPWLLGAGALLLVVGTALRGFRRPAPGNPR